MVVDTVTNLRKNNMDIVIHLNQFKAAVAEAGLPAIPDTQLESLVYFLGYKLEAHKVIKVDKLSDTSAALYGLIKTKLRSKVRVRKIHTCSYSLLSQEFTFSGYR